jgi:biotin transporter BioY
MSQLHADILPLVVAMIDFPASVLASWLSDALQAKGVIDALIYVVVSSIWFYLIGFLLQIIVQKLKSKNDLA